MYIIINIILNPSGIICKAVGPQAAHLRLTSVSFVHPMSEFKQKFKNRITNLQELLH